ncbi:hypothetical protein EGH21_17400 [Halomicroarcula sp. F13]|uniref:Uncharacterized protein n=4 Tax=Haloarcula TaxID=2237 RepID=A0A8J7YKU7_9EURY|nr:MULTISPECIES: hypothetical protein [Haloarculaceae]MBX0288061.1 hypothetical protein [Halomicroarcula salinisoli]MBX0305568.1 hypothetical protein [Halomicroarcula salinisoli]MBX0324805.1 hypothetical protein [Halomicroarcula rubra]MDS0261743.1 hypothetical protein [Haloarcula sp. S1CR25-12]MDS0283999.1 hypothetical protein [Halomicroarcula sp. S3CR25-11]
MSSTSEDTEQSPTADEQSGLPYGPFLVLLSATVVAGSGLLVYTMEQANLPLVADFVWILGYGVAVCIIWVVWLRPVELVGPAGRETGDSSKNEDTTADSSAKDGPEWEISGWGELAKVPSEKGGDTQNNTPESVDTSSSKDIE